MVLEKIKSRFRKGGAARDVATLTIGTMLAQGLTIAVTPLLSRLYTPGDFGLLAVFLAVSGVAATLITGRYETAIVVPKEDNEAGGLVLLSLLLALTSAVFLSISGTFLSASFVEKLGFSSLNGWFPLVFFVAGATAVMAIVQNWFNRQKNYSIMAKLRVAQSAGIASFALFFGMAPGWGHGLLLAQSLTYIITAAIALWLARSVASFWKETQFPHIAYIHKNAPKYLLPTALLDVATLQMPVVLVATWFGENMAGQFSMAWRLLMLPMALVGGAVGQVFLRNFALIRENTEEARKMLKNIWIALMVMGFFPMAIIFLLGELIFPLVLGREWSRAGAMAEILAPMALAIFVSSPTSGSYVVLGIQHYSPLFGLASLIYRPASLYFGLYMGSLMIGLKVWVFFEILQILIYQFVAWKSIKNYRVSE